MPVPPTKAEVLAETRKQVAAYALLEPVDVNDAWELKGQYLGLDDTALGFLADSLTTYAETFRKDVQIRPPDCRKSGQTVNGLAALVFERITQ